jgi:transcriptional regulator with XRE-family HTH domain
MGSRDLAVRLGVSPQAVTAWERGIARPDAHRLATLAAVLDVPVDLLDAAWGAE